MTPLFRTLALSLMLPIWAAAGHAQAPEANPHAGHDHAPKADMPVPDIDFVFTESPDDHVIGDASAPITIISYASVTCPHCSEWFINDWPTLKADHIDTGNIRFVLREFPTAPAQLSLTGFLIANCGPEDRYFGHIEHQMREQKTIMEEAFTEKAPETYAKLGAMAGMNTFEEMNACFEKPDGMARINRSAQRAQAAKISGVPAFFVNGVQFAKSPTAANLDAEIKRLNSSGTSGAFQAP